MNSAADSRSAPRIELRTSNCTCVRRAASIALRCQLTASECGLESKNTLSTPSIAVTSEPSSARSPVTAPAAAGRLLADSCRYAYQNPDLLSVSQQLCDQRSADLAAATDDKNHVFLRDGPLPDPNLGQ